MIKNKVLRICWLLNELKELGANLSYDRSEEEIDLKVDDLLYASGKTLDRLILDLEYIYDEETE